VGGLGGWAEYSEFHMGGFFVRYREGEAPAEPFTEATWERADPTKHP